ncbi:macro domain-containing protein PG1779 isoform X2 [Lasioglossum baleicum]|uniref:macro domain-containing protein PG1779 isoform X2 n=1 Tax=Lasioglossum baleicum TaxID=434251 RepID=UPI003FCDD225
MIRTRIFDRFSIATILGLAVQNSLLGRNLATTPGTEESMSFEAEKQKFLTMPSQEKRKYYKGTVKTLDQIPTLLDYFDENKERLIDKDKVRKVEEIAKKVSIWSGDITSLEIDAIVNAANSSLLGGGGVDGAIHRAAGPNLKRECATLKGCKVGEAKITGGYMLPAKYVIHTVGPQGSGKDKLTACYQNSLALASENGLRSIAFPCISTGIYGFPQGPAAEIAMSTVKEFLEKKSDALDRVIFCVFLKSDWDLYEDLATMYLSDE